MSALSLVLPNGSILTARDYPSLIRKHTVVKLDALRQIARYIGLIGPLRKICSPDPVVPTDPMVQATLLAAPAIIRDRDSEPYQVAACIMLLDICRPGWRQSADHELFYRSMQRGSPEVRLWRLAVLRRDDRKCRSCGSASHLHAHHILPWIDYPHLRIDADNGLTLCQACHKNIHSGKLLISALAQT